MLENLELQELKNCKLANCNVINLGKLSIGSHVLVNFEYYIFKLIKKCDKNSFDYIKITIGRNGTYSIEKKENVTLNHLGSYVDNAFIINPSDYNKIDKIAKSLFNNIKKYKHQTDYKEFYDISIKSNPYLINDKVRISHPLFDAMSLESYKTFIENQNKVNTKLSEAIEKKLSFLKRKSLRSITNYGDSIFLDIIKDITIERKENVHKSIIELIPTITFSKIYLFKNDSITFFQDDFKLPSHDFFKMMKMDSAILAEANYEKLISNIFNLTDMAKTICFESSFV